MEQNQRSADKTAETQEGTWWNLHNVCVTISISKADITIRLDYVRGQEILYQNENG